MRILVINPVGHSTWDKQDEEICRGFASPETEVKVVSLPKGPASVETPEAHAEVIPLVLDVARRSHEGFDAVVVNCFLDPGVDFLKGVLNKPVVGPCEASLSIASVVGRRISIITVGGVDGDWMIEDRVRQLGFGDRVVSVRGIPVGVLDIDKDRASVVNHLVREAEKAKDEGVDVIVLGCTGLAGLAGEVQRRTGVFTIDPTGAAIKVAEALIKLEITGFPYRR